MGRRKKVSTVDPFVREDSLQISPTITIQRGDIIKIEGEHGLKFKFLSVVTNPRTGVIWVDCFELQKGGTEKAYICRAFRSFYPDRVRHIPKRRKRVPRT